MDELIERISANVASIRRRIADAAVRSGRRADDVSLVSVTKYVDSRLIRALLATGCRDCGESRPQQLWNKAEELGDCDIRWHMIGHLQRNKARRTIPLISLLHSGDGMRLLRTVDSLSEELGRTTDVLLEVNISGDAAKDGFQPEELEPILPDLAGLQHLRIRGLMAMARLAGSPDETRSDFAALRQLREQLVASCPPQISLDELSMGMSGDFEIAIEEGATMVRVGSALFEGVRC
jgi:pyridoxal phosphate enzyme (YggS family)